MFLHFQQLFNMGFYRVKEEKSRDLARLFRLYFSFLKFAQPVEAVQYFGSGQAAVREEVVGKGACHGSDFAVSEYLTLYVEQTAVHVVELVIFERARRDSLVAQDST